ncbi:MAG: O-antigen ligase domain-containing protein [Novosphingobium sp.]|nr:O-antigen ligase domain-containing protein [Novosphingobium sp.]
MLGWTLAFLAARSWYLAPSLPADERPGRLPPALWSWLLGMATMLIILFIGHSQFQLGTGQTIKSAVGWAKGWALLTLFPMAGFALPVRPEAIARAVCRLGLQTLVLLPIFLVAPYAGLPERLWVSPLAVLGGSGDEYFAAMLYTIEPGVGTARWQFFAPWSPAAGMVAVIHFLLARLEPHAGWRWTGYSASVLVALLSQSRLALIALAVIVPVAWLAGKGRKPALWFGFAVAALAGSWVAPQLSALADKLSNDFSSARADSSRVRAALGRIAVQRWQSEAYWFGHGIVERGPHMVEYMPIGSHHTWFGLLFVKGLAGAAALAVPMVWTLLATIRAAVNGRVGQLGFAMAITYWLYSFGENLEVLTYIAWPALLAIGIALRPAQPAADFPPPAEPAAG